MPSFVVDKFSLPNSGLSYFGASWLRLISIYIITNLLLFINLYICRSSEFSAPQMKQFGLGSQNYLKSRLIMLSISKQLWFPLCKTFIVWFLCSYILPLFPRLQLCVVLVWFIWPGLPRWLTFARLFYCVLTTAMFLSGIIYCAKNFLQHHSLDPQFFLIRDWICWTSFSLMTLKR
jgi:hypothetical protein